MKSKYIFSIIVILILTIILFTNVSYAQSVGDDITQWEFKIDQDIPSIVLKYIGVFIAFVRNMSIIITIIVITLLGIKFMLGSVQEKAEYKQSFITIIIGSIFITMSITIVDAIFTLVAPNTR